MATDISKMSITELKALAYDLSLQARVIDQDLAKVNQRITALLNNEGMPKRTLDAVMENTEGDADDIDPDTE